MCTVCMCLWVCAYVCTRTPAHVYICVCACVLVGRGAAESGLHAHSPAWSLYVKAMAAGRMVVAVVVAVGQHGMSGQDAAGQGGVEWPRCDCGARSQGCRVGFLVGRRPPIAAPCRAAHKHVNAHNARIQALCALQRT